METMSATVKEVITNTPTVKTIVLEPENKLDFQPGQWIYIFADNNGEKIKRPYSVASAVGEAKLCIKRVDNGFMSNYLCELKAGDKLEISKPFGIFAMKDTDKEIIFVATGTGIAPFMSMIPELIKNGYDKPVKVVFGVRNKDEIL